MRMGSASLLFFAVGLCLFAEVANDLVSGALDFLSVVGRAAKRAEKMANSKDIATSSSHQTQVTEAIASYDGAKLSKDNNFRSQLIAVCRKLSYQQSIADLTLSEENRIRLIACPSCGRIEYFKDIDRNFENVDEVLNFVRDFGHKILRMDLATGVVQSVCSGDILSQFIHQHKDGALFWTQLTFQRAVIQACQTLNEMNEYKIIISINDNQARFAGCQCIKLLTNDFTTLKPPKDNDPLTILELEVYDHLEMLGQSIQAGDEVSLSEFYTSHADVPKAMAEGRFRKVCKNKVMFTQAPRRNGRLPFTMNQEMRVAACRWLASQCDWSAQ